MWLVLTMTASISSSVGAERSGLKRAGRSKKSKESAEFEEDEVGFGEDEDDCED